MPSKKLFLILLLIFIADCSTSTKIYKVDYKGKMPQGTFKATIGNATIFTNGPDVLEVSVKSKPEFFCYSVNKNVLCNFDIDVKVSQSAAEKYFQLTQKLREIAMKYARSRSILPDKLSYYIRGNLENENVILISELKNQTADILPISIVGNGTTEEAAKDNAIKKSKEILDILTDKA